MYDYLFSNDMRTKDIKRRLIEYSKNILDDQVPSAEQEKSVNNSTNSIGFYFNLENKGLAAKLCACGKVKPVINNFVYTFQFPNPRSKESLEKQCEDNIRIAPLREIIKILFLLKQIDEEEAYLTKDEILDFIFYNDDLAKKANPNRVQITQDIINKRNGISVISKITTDKDDRGWKQEGRQLNDMLSIFKESDYVIMDENKNIKLKNFKDKCCHADLFYILNNNEYWIPDSNLDLDSYKKSYADYCENKIGLFIDCEDVIVSKNKIDKPYQRIFFGAPGTGKSYMLNKEAKDYFGDNYKRVTFHPNYMYGNFVGSFKPYPRLLKDENGDFVKDKYGNIQETITYKYVPGPLLKSFVEAYKNPHINYLLIIEEINRANTASVFGDMFQLLDRNEKGESEYPVDASEDVQMYLKEAFDDVDDYIYENIIKKIGTEYNKLIFPSNLYIWATMNSADQGVMPMDTAFKRRWDFEYIGINDALEDPQVAEEFENYKFKITKDRIAKWDDFRTEINQKLAECNVPEDKLIGPYFISKSVLESGDVDEITEAIKNKVLMYVYEDAGKPYKNNLFVSEKSRTYSDLCKNFSENGNAIFRKPMQLGNDTLYEDKEETQDTVSDINADYSTNLNKDMVADPNSSEK